MSQWSSSPRQSSERHSAVTPAEQRRKGRVRRGAPNGLGDTRGGARPSGWVTVPATGTQRRNRHVSTVCDAATAVTFRANIHWRVGGRLFEARPELVLPPGEADQIPEHSVRLLDDEVIAVKYGSSRQQNVGGGLAGSRSAGVFMMSVPSVSSCSAALANDWTTRARSIRSREFAAFTSASAAGRVS